MRIEKKNLFTFLGKEAIDCFLKKEKQTVTLSEMKLLKKIPLFSRNNSKKINKKNAQHLLSKWFVNDFLNNLQNKTIKANNKTNGRSLFVALLIRTSVLQCVVFSFMFKLSSKANIVLVVLVSFSLINSDLLITKNNKFRPSYIL